jgi:starch synthase
MRVLFAAAELAPLVRVGGLGEVAGGLTKSLRAAGAHVDMLLPDYFGTELVDEFSHTLDVPDWVGACSARTGELPGFGQLTLIDVPDIRRAGPYGDPAGHAYDDNDRRFFRFSAAVAAWAQITQPDVIHVNDWHTGAALAWTPIGIPSVVSIHNLAYQGDADRGWLQVFGERSYAYDRRGRCNPLTGSLILADRVVAVSPKYSREILVDPLGCGLTDVLGSKAGAGQLVGIINGIDADEWNPETDQLLPATFSAKKRTGKATCKAALQTTLGLTLSGGPLFGFVSRLVDQKGIEFVVEAATYLSSMDGQLVVLGSGDQQLADALHRLAADNPEIIAFREGFDVALSHHIFAGADCYLMPSRFEPCGLAQMQAMAYGALPIVTDVGGLHDTVTDLTINPDIGTGFVTREVSATGLVDAMHRASALFQKKTLWKAAQSRGMTHDWTWIDPTRQYLSLYSDVIDAKSP